MGPPDGYESEAVGCFWNSRKFHLM
jgi:hypothetical protein